MLALHSKCVLCTLCKASMWINIIKSWTLNDSVYLIHSCFWTYCERLIGACYSKKQTNRFYLKWHPETSALYIVTGKNISFLIQTLMDEFPVKVLNRCFSTLLSCPFLNETLVLLKWNLCVDLDFTVNSLNKASLSHTCRQLYGSAVYCVSGLFKSPAFIRLIIYWHCQLMKILFKLILNVTY